MWIFGQVWFACLVGFAAGVLLDWVVRVRPLASRITDLEMRLEAETRSMRAEAVANGGSMFERGSYEAPGRFDSTGFEGDHGRGLLTPSGSGAGSGSGSNGLTTDLLDHPSSADPDDLPVPSGVEDYPGVARLSGIWADESAEETRVTHGSAWEHDPEPATLDAGEAEAAAAAASAAALTPPASDADQQYLEFLRSGGAEPIVSGSDETPDEVTSVLPYTIPGEDAEGYSSYEAYDEFSGNGYAGNGHHSQAYDAQSYGEYSDEVVEPVESSGPLPHRDTTDFGHRYAPFEIPFGQFDNSDVQPHTGEMTPIGESGFQPFQKQADLGDLGDFGDQPTDPSSWFDLTDPGPGSLGPASGGPGPVGSGPVGSGSVGSESASMTSRMLPVGLPGAEHPDLLGTSVFGNENDVVYEDDGRSRSLFEPIIAPDSIPDPDSVSDESSEYGQHAYEAPSSFDASSYSAPAYDPTGGQGTTPRPIRVRTGMDAAPANGSASVGSHSLATDRMDVPPGPFGPGSALPMPDGTAPSSEFRVKARTSSMVFHTESSPFYERLEPQVWFRDAKDAQRAGFTSWERPRSW